MAFTLVDLFCGGGGFTRGFAQEGFKPVLGLDVERAVAETYRVNFSSSKVLVEDIREVGWWRIEREVDEVDVIIGSPPCEPFTKTNPKRERNPLDRLYKDPEGQLTLHFIRLVGDLQPKIFVMENVVDAMEGPLREALAYEFRRVGFERVFFDVLRAEHYGTPSKRRRLFVSNIKLAPPRLRKVICVEEALQGLPDPRSIHDIPNHVVTPISERKLKKITRMKWGDCLVVYPGAKGVFTNYVRLHPRRLAPVVSGGKRFIHPFEDRLLTVREQARLMGFPDDHVFLGGRELEYNMVGEAVPVPLARAIAAEVKKALEGGSF